MTRTARARATRAVRAHAPELSNVDVRELGHGLDNVAFVAAGLVLRVADPDTVHREARLLELLAPRLPVPIPRPRFLDDSGVLAYPLLPGRPLLGQDPPRGLGAVLGRFLHELHSVELAAVAQLVATENADPADWLTDLEAPAELVDVLRSTVPPPASRRVLTHADLGAEHILVDGDTVTGIIDWTDAAIADPALDFARIYRDFGPTVLDEALRAYGGLDGARPRIAFYARCAALEDLAYGRRTERREYADAAERSVRRLFRDSDRPEAATPAPGRSTSS